MASEDMTMQFETVANHWWGANPVNADALARSARLALWQSGEPQAVHYHDEDGLCARGDSCYVIRLAEART